MFSYSLRINTKDNQEISKISRILGVEPNYPAVGWGVEIVKKGDYEYVDFINYFLSILEGKYEDLKNMGISTNDISVWILYEYDEQCNMELSPLELKRLGDAGLALCISCWQK